MDANVRPSNDSAASGAMLASSTGARNVLERTDAQSLGAMLDPLQLAEVIRRVRADVGAPSMSTANISRQNNDAEFGNSDDAQLDREDLMDE